MKKYDIIKKTAESQRDAELNSGQAQNLIQHHKNKEYTKRNIYKCFLEHAPANVKIM